MITRQSGDIMFAYIKKDHPIYHLSRNDIRVLQDKYGS